jgi:hypothetical protein
MSGYPQPPNYQHSQPPPPQQQQHQQPGGYPNGTFSTSFNTQRHKKRILKVGSQMIS